MNHFRVILYYALLFTIPCFSKKKVNSGFNVNYVLKQVMLSDSFDELADKIADKAVKKIKDMEHFEMTRIAHSDSNGEVAYRVSESELKNKTNTTKEIVTKSTNNKNESVLINPISKVNTLDLINKQAVGPIKGLSLKFRDFTKKFKHISNNNMPYKERTRKIEPMVSFSKDTLPDAVPIQNQVKPIHTSEKIDETTNAFDNKNPETEIESSIEDYMNQATYKQKDVQRKQNTQEPSVKTVESHLKNGQKALLDTAEPDTLDDRTKRKHNVIIATQPNPENERLKLTNVVVDEDSPSLEIDDYEAVNRDQSTYETSTTNTQSSLATTTKRHRSKRKKKAHHKKKSQKVIRREGNKLFTFEKSPDYAEYDQQLLGIQNNNKGN